MPGVPQSLVGCALLASETAADIARRCRSDTRLLSLLVQEKCGDDANHSRFARDFKTLADVLVQCVVAKRIGQQFPELNDSVYGEENDTIQNNVGRDVTIRVGDTVDETLECLCEALDNDLESARSLAEAAHRQFTVDQLNVDLVPPDSEVLDLTKVGIWIDPIDSTNEYISGNVEAENEFGFHSSGLHCVTINIGVFDKETGKPLAGVINQPFYMRDADKRWSGRCYWALCNQQQKGLHSLPTFVNENKLAPTLQSESYKVTENLINKSELNMSVVSVLRGNLLRIIAIKCNTNIGCFQSFILFFRISKKGK
ncbi:inositol polyphosphate 1-phosphatase isoform X2 [Adelges cooleyi]|uniref:inositol polyphosphate 1-phosphatase isoform X2 n=1 Tax=Adelges cooleyi TaxID=133065 RepID=UPI0021805D4D|nr:inositol polyphosphate 1-phosphatase isoform X2 [Adelges cooleyi]